ncbi:hypothetical protein Amal_03582 [Acetobacter malorum]|uniref:Uncharacterized protein n=1 Tax=Acetobacter malorum TaxID=178901 RepID=A0A177G4F9_9PROT|nr:hypothetical protein Amal_03582 [Acetobacter malorum]
MMNTPVVATRKANTTPGESTAVAETSSATAELASTARRGKCARGAMTCRARGTSPLHAISYTTRDVAYKPELSVDKVADKMTSVITALAYGT